MDGSRLRAHGQYSTDGRLFIKFIALILYTDISKVMKENDLYKKGSFRELLSELKKLKITRIKNEDPFLSELTKKQKTIFKAFGIREEDIHSY